MLSLTTDLQLRRWCSAPPALVAAVLLPGHGRFRPWPQPLGSCLGLDLELSGCCGLVQWSGPELPSWACPVLHAWGCGTAPLAQPWSPGPTGPDATLALLFHDTVERKIFRAGGIWFYVEHMCGATKRKCKCVHYGHSAETLPLLKKQSKNKKST